MAKVCEKLFCPPSGPCSCPTPVGFGNHTAKKIQPINAGKKKPKSGKRRLTKSKHNDFNANLFLQDLFGLTIHPPLEENQRTTVRTGRNQNKVIKVYPKHKDIVKALSNILTPSQEDSLFVVSGKDSIIKRLNTHVGRNCHSGVVSGILRDIYEIDVRQVNICPICDLISKKDTCGEHYRQSLQQGRNRKVMALGIKFR